MDVFLVLGSVVAAVAALFWFCTTEIPSDKGENALGAAVVTSVLLGLISGIAWLATYTGSAEDVSALEAFYNDTRSAYEVTISETQALVVQTPAGRITDFAQHKQAVAVSERLKEFRGKIDWYNGELRRLRRMNDMFFIGEFHYDVPDYLKPIRLA